MSSLGWIETAFVAEEPARSRRRGATSRSREELRRGATRGAARSREEPVEEPRGAPSAAESGAAGRLPPFAREAAIPEFVVAEEHHLEQPPGHAGPLANPLSKEGGCPPDGHRDRPRRRVTRREEVPAALPRLSHERGPGSTAGGVIIISARPGSAPGSSPRASPPPCISSTTPVLQSAAVAAPSPVLA